MRRREAGFVAAVAAAPWNLVPGGLAVVALGFLCGAVGAAGSGG